MSEVQTKLKCIDYHSDLSRSCFHRGFFQVLMLLFLLGFGGARPMAPQQYGGGMVTSSSGMFPMQQQPLIGGMSSQQYQYQAPRNQTPMNNRNDLQDLFG